MVAMVSFDLLQDTFPHCCDIMKCAEVVQFCSFHEIMLVLVKIIINAMIDNYLRH